LATWQASESASLEESINNTAKERSGGSHPKSWGRGAVKGTEIEQDGAGKRVRKRVLKLVGQAEVRKSLEKESGAWLRMCPRRWKERL